MRYVPLILAILLIPMAVSAAPTRRTQPAATPHAVFRFTDSPIFFQSAPDIRVDLDFENVSVREALKRIFDQAKQEFVVEEDVPEDTRITVRARNVLLRTALDLISQAAGINWRSTSENRGLVFRFSKSAAVPPGGLGLFRIPDTKVAPEALQGLLGDQPVIRWDGLANTGLSPYVHQFFQEQTTFVCPHCKERSTMVGPRQQPKCPKCSRTFQAGWQFCPVDGARRPPAPGEWRFCPHCGKEVRSTDPAAAAP